MKRYQENVFEDFAREFIRCHHGPGPLWLVERILVATDFSLCSLTALEHAEELARSFAAELLLLHVEDTPNGAGGVPHRSHAAAEHELARIIQHLRDDRLEARSLLRLWSGCGSYLRGRSERTRGPHRHGYPRAHGHDARAHGQRCSARGAQRAMSSPTCGAARMAR